MENKFVRVGIIGTGDIFNSHSQAYPDHPYAVVTAFYDRIKSRAQSWYERMKELMNMIRESYEDENPEDLEEDEKGLLEKVKIFEKEARVYDTVKDLMVNVDVIDICTPNYAHAQYAIWALKVGKSVMVEKPPARCSLETQWLVEAAKNSKAKFQLNENFFWQAFVEKLGELVAAGKIGTVKKMNTMLGHTGPSWGFNNHFLNPSLSGGGCMSDMGIHAIGFGYGVVGQKFKVKNITAVKLKSGTQPERTMKDSDGWNVYELKRFLVEDHAKTKLTLINSETQQEIKWTIETSWAKQMQGITIEGSEGTLALELNEKKQIIIAFYNKEGKREVIPIPPQRRDSHVLECIEFCANIVEGKLVRVDAEWAHQMQIIISGTYLSWLKGFRESDGSRGIEVTPEDLDKYYKSFIDAGTPTPILIEDIVYDLMSPFTEHYFTPGKKFTEESNVMTAYKDMKKE